MRVQTSFEKGYGCYHNSRILKTHDETTRNINHVIYFAGKTVTLNPLQRYK